jgi:hypothetical protein
MSDDLGDFFALPPFKADEALVKLRRDLKALKLTERGAPPQPRFDWKGLPVVELDLADPALGKPAIVAGLVKRPGSRPQWARQTLSSSAEVRKWLDALQRSLQQWGDDD